MVLELLLLFLFLLKDNALGSGRRWVLVLIKLVLLMVILFLRDALYA